VLQDAHKQLNALKVENSELRQELALLHCKLPQQKISSTSNPSSDLSTYDEEITKLGKVFVHCFSLWINPAPPSPFHAPCLPFKWNSQDRYLHTDSITSGPTAELYACVPPKFHDYMEKHECFQDIVCIPSYKLTHLMTNRLFSSWRVCHLATPTCFCVQRHQCSTGF